MIVAVAASLAIDSSDRIVISNARDPHMFSGSGYFIALHSPDNTVERIPSCVCRGTSSEQLCMFVTPFSVNNSPVLLVQFACHLGDLLDID